MDNTLKISAGLIALSLVSAGKPLAQNRPNILFILADDQRADAMGCAGNPYISTPNIDQLAKQGVRFSNSYVMGGHHGAISAPSRAMLLSGKSLFKVYDRLEGVQTMPAYLAQHGYQTFGTGKWHNEKQVFESSFEKGKNVFLGGMCNHFSVPCQDIGSDGKLGQVVQKSYSTDLFADAAIGFINEYGSGKKERPFFCYVAFTAPHDPRSPKDEYVGLYPDGTIPLPGNFKKAHPFAFDDLLVRDEHLTTWPRTPEAIQSSLSDYYALITHLDEKVGQIVAALKKQGLYENTIIVYAADNGLAIGSHGLLGKQNLYEHSTKVPMILAGPGISKGQTSEALVYLFDLFPSLCSLTNLPAPIGIDGKNIAPILKGKQTEIRKSLYTVYRNTVRAVRTNKWKLITYPLIHYNQLFDLENDPLEINNLANKPENKDKVLEMSKLMSEWHRTTGDTANLNPTTKQPMEYDYKKLKQKPDKWQPDYILKRYFEPTND